MTKKEILIDQLKAMEERLGRPMVIVETGTIRNTEDNYARGDGHSTLHICNFLKSSKYMHTFFSVDLKTDVCKKYLNSKGLLGLVKLKEMDSVDFLKSFNKKIDFLYLDSANNGGLILKEFLTAEPKLSNEYTLIVDDVDDGTKPHLKKGNAIKRHFADKKNVIFFIVNNMIIYRSWELTK